eukprot:m51a1_g9477 hypothetical protein (355) ;mRNA; r:594563-595627
MLPLDRHSQSRTPQPDASTPSSTAAQPYRDDLLVASSHMPLDSLDMIAELGAMLETQFQGRVAANKEYEKRIADLESALFDANLRLEAAEEESELNKKLLVDAQNDLKLNAAPVAAPTDRAEICQLTSALESLHVEVQRQAELLSEAEAQRARDATTYEARIKDLATEVEEARCKMSETETDLKRHVELADLLRAELSDRIRDDDKRIAEMSSELTKTKSALDVSEKARETAVADARRASFRLLGTEKALETEEEKYEEFFNRAHQAEALVRRLQIQLEAATKKISSYGLFPKPAAGQDENAKAVNMSQPVRRSLPAATAFKMGLQYPTYPQYITRLPSSGDGYHSNGSGFHSK